MFELEGLARYYAPNRSRSRRCPPRRAVDGVDHSVPCGETLGLVGESGCGKSTLARLMLRLERPTGGAVRYQGLDLWGMSRGDVRRFRREVQMVFQDPFASLDPRMRVGEIVGEGLAIHRIASGRARRKRVQELMEQVGLPPEAESNYPHEFSGGQRQRVGIARALAVEPRVLIADEPVSALDVSVQAQILNLLRELKSERQLTYVLISHDLRVVKHVSDRVAVMYLGKIAELGPVEDLFARPLHPYTQALLKAIPIPDPGIPPADPPLEGEVPSATQVFDGCPFHPRCPEAFAPCFTGYPQLRCPPGGKDRSVACHLYR